MSPKNPLHYVACHPKKRSLPLRPGRGGHLWSRFSIPKDGVRSPSHCNRGTGDLQSQGRPDQLWPARPQNPEFHLPRPGTLSPVQSKTFLSLWFGSWTFLVWPLRAGNSGYRVPAGSWAKNKSLTNEQEELMLCTNHTDKISCNSSTRGTPNACPNPLPRRNWLQTIDLASGEGESMPDQGGANTKKKLNS